MGNAAFIPVVLPNYNVTSQGVSIGFGHAAFILVNADGSAQYVEYGLYKQDAFSITNNGNGNIRELSLQSVQFDSFGNVTNQSLKSALDQVFGSSGMYTGDTGEAVGASFSISQTQFSNVQTFIDSQITSINNLQESYSLTTNDCFQFVYNAANAGGFTISRPKAFRGQH